MAVEAFLTIVTVTYEAEAFLERTLESVSKALVFLPEEQHVQYLIIDGASKDGTLKVAEAFHDLLGLEIYSEPDRGLYDAMNKGLQYARGKYVWFLNAGDQVHDKAVLSKFYEATASGADVYYSDALFVAQNGQSLGLRSVITPHSLEQHLSWKDMALGMKICHQAFIVRTNLAPEYEVDNLSADLDWEITAMKRASKIQYLDFVLCKYLTGGLSTQRHRKSLVGRWEVLRKHFGVLPALLNHFRILFRGALFILKKGKYW